jgi:hypothetical protein
MFGLQDRRLVDWRAERGAGHGEQEEQAGRVGREGQGD